MAVVADVDECQELFEACDGVGVCVNNMGSYLCSCSEGYQQVNGTSCQGEGGRVAGEGGSAVQHSQTTHCH